MNLSWNLQKMTDLNDFKNGPAIKILYDNMKKQALIVFLHYFLISIFKKVSLFLAVFLS